MYIDTRILDMISYWGIWVVCLVVLFFVASSIFRGNFKSILAIIFVCVGLYVMYLGMKGGL